MFDRIVSDAAIGGHSNPWTIDGNGTRHFHVDFEVLHRLLGVPLYLKATPRSGVPALALDVWVAYELRRAGFDPDAVWPRAEVPRILPGSISQLLSGLNNKEKEPLLAKLKSGNTLGGAVGASAKMLGKNYEKQVDVVVSSWQAGAELMISTKRMDSSFGKNAANRVEESYGDAKNLRSRHPQSALGFVYGLRSTIYLKEESQANWIVDLLGKLGREDDAYDAVALLILDYGADFVPEDSDEVVDNPLVAAGLVPDETEGELVPVEPSYVDQALAALPPVTLLHDKVPRELEPGRFFEVMVNRILDNCPINFHDQARRVRAGAQPA